MGEFDLAIGAYWQTFGPSWATAMRSKQYTTAAVDNIPTAAWRLESGNLAESAPTFRAVVAAPKSLAFYFKASRELLADAANMDAALNVAIAHPACFAVVTGVRA